MRRPLVLSGGPAVGKSTCGRALAAERPRAAFIDADDIRQLIVTGDATLWSGPEGRAQHLLAARNVSSIGHTLADAGFEVTVADVVTHETLPVYRRELAGCFIVHQQISLEAARRRAATRPVHLTDAEFDLLHEITACPPAVDVILDVTDMTLAEQLTAIRSAWRSGSNAA